jgi:D-3-phosphoglycerate dehydrogenase
LRIDGYCNERYFSELEMELSCQEPDFRTRADQHIMRVVIPDDYQDCVRQLRCFATLKQHEVTVFNDTVRDIKTLARRFADAHALVLTRERTRITAQLLDQLPHLQIICQTGKLSSHVDLAACTERGIAVSDGSGTGCATAELTWALVLASRRHLISEVNGFHAGRWQNSIGQQLHGYRLGIWSYGRIGQKVAAYGKVFGMRVWIWGGSASSAMAQADGFELAPSQEAFFSDSDVISMHLRLNSSTCGIVGEADLARMKPSALLVNTSRAELIAPGALVRALQQGRPGFAAIDVYEEEPVLGAQHPLLRLGNALCTPHLGYVEKDNYEHYFGLAFDAINCFSAGEFVALNNPNVKYRSQK